MGKRTAAQPARRMRTRLPLPESTFGYAWPGQVSWLRARAPGRAFPAPGARVASCGWTSPITVAGPSGIRTPFPLRPPFQSNGDNPDRCRTNATHLAAWRMERGAAQPTPAGRSAQAWSGTEGPRRASKPMRASRPTSPRHCDRRRPRHCDRRRPGTAADVAQAARTVVARATAPRRPGGANRSNSAPGVAARGAAGWRLHFPPCATPLPSC